MEELPRNIIASKSIGDAVVLTLAVVARFPTSATCDAIATHLMGDATPFAALQGMEACAYALQVLADLNEFESIKESALDAVPFLVEHAAAILDVYGREGGCHPRRASVIFSCLSPKNAVLVQSFHTFLSQGFDPSQAIDRAYSLGKYPSFMSGLWDWREPNTRFVRGLLSYLWVRPPSDASLHRMAYFLTSYNGVRNGSFSIQC